MDSPAYTSDNDSDTESVRSVRNTVHAPVAHDHTDLSGVPICLVCDRLLEEDQPQIQLMCHHSYHTACFLTFFYEDYYRRCPTCQVPVMGHLVDEVRTIISERIRQKKEKKKESLRDKVMANKELIADLKVVKKHMAQARKSSVAFRQLGRRVQREFNQETAAMKEILKGIKKRQKEALLKSAEMKEWKTKRMRAQYYMRIFDLKYRDTPLNLLNTVPEFRLPSRWAMRSAFHISWWVIDRWLRIRI